MTQPEQILATFGEPWNQPGTLIRPIAGGYSGARVWQVGDPGRLACLRRWPARFDPERIQSLHLLLEEFHRAKFMVPGVIRGPTGESLARDGEYSWDLSEWLAGEALPTKSPSDRILAGVRVLVGWHRLARNMDGSAFPRQPLADERRLQRFRERRISIASAARSELPALPAILAQRTMALAAIAEGLFEQILPCWRDEPIRSICLRDVHREHILFSGERPTGLIDFSTVGWDRPATDLARWLGSFDPDHVPVRDVWRPAAKELSNVFPDARDWTRFAVVLAQTGDVVAALNWLQWLVIERREFPNTAAAIDRWSETVDRAERRQAREDMSEFLRESS